MLLTIDEQREHVLVLESVEDIGHELQPVVNCSSYASYVYKFLHKWAVTLFPSCLRTYEYEAGEHNGV